MDHTNYLAKYKAKLRVVAPLIQINLNITTNQLISIY
jgi:hypothetical protein